MQNKRLVKSKSSTQGLNEMGDNVNSSNPTSQDNHRDISDRNVVINTESPVSTMRGYEPDTEVECEVIIDIEQESGITLQDSKQAPTKSPESKLLPDMTDTLLYITMLKAKHIQQKAADYYDYQRQLTNRCFIRPKKEQVSANKLEEKQSKKFSLNT